MWMFVGEMWGPQGLQERDRAAPRTMHSWMRTKPWTFVFVLLTCRVLPSVCDCDRDDLTDPTRVTEAVYSAKQTFSEGEQHEYKCPPGYLNQNDRRTATCRNSQWEFDTANPLVCTGAGCGAPGGQISIANGRQNGNIYTFPNKVTFECNAGYRMVASSGSPLNAPFTIYCQSDGTWTDPPPRCEVVTCPNPNPATDPNMNQVQVDKLEYGGEANYTCKRNYRLAGSTIRRCLATGTWSNAEPTCQGAYLGHNLSFFTFVCVWGEGGRGFISKEL